MIQGWPGGMPAISFGASVYPPPFSRDHRGAVWQLPPAVPWWAFVVIVSELLPTHSHGTSHLPAEWRGPVTPPPPRRRLVPHFHAVSPTVQDALVLLTSTLLPLGVVCPPFACRSYWATSRPRRQRAAVCADRPSPRAPAHLELGVRSGK